MSTRGWWLVVAGWCSLPLACLAVESKEDDQEVAGEVVGGEVRVLALPEWRPEDLLEFEENARPRNLGGGLWPAEFFPLERVPEPLSLDVEILDPSSLPDLNGEGGAPAMSAELRESYFGERPGEGLVDPQRLVEEPYRGNIMRFLKYHVEESTMTTFVLVLRADQELPEGVSTGEVWSRWFPEGNGAIILYHIGRPNQTAIEFGNEMARRAGRARLQSILDACVRDAVQTKNESAQLERFCVKYSIQAYWLERDLKRALQEEQQARVAYEAEELEQRSWWLRHRGAVMVTLLCAGIAGLALWNSLRRRVVMFPEIEVPMRLGGVFCGGSDAVVHFGRGVGFDDDPEVLE